MWAPFSLSISDAWPQILRAVRFFRFAGQAGSATNRLRPGALPRARAFVYVERLKWERARCRCRSLRKAVTS